MEIILADWILHSILLKFPFFGPAHRHGVLLSKTVFFSYLLEFSPNWHLFQIHGVGPISITIDSNPYFFVGNCAILTIFPVLVPIWPNLRRLPQFDKIPNRIFRFVSQNRKNHFTIFGTKQSLCLKWFNRKKHNVRSWCSPERTQF